MEDILFLALFLGIPVAMLLALGWLAVRALRARLAWGAALRGDWTAASEADLRALLRDYPPLARDGRVAVDRVARRPDRGAELWTARYRWTSRGRGESRQGVRQAWLVLPWPAPLPRAVVMPRTGGWLEGAALAVAGAFGGVRDDLPASWGWAIVSGPGDRVWFTDARAAAVKALLRPGEELHFHDRAVVLAVPDGGQPALMRGAVDRADALRRALD